MDKTESLTNSHKEESVHICFDDKDNESQFVITEGLSVSSDDIKKRSAESLTNLYEYESIHLCSDTNENELQLDISSDDNKKRSCSFICGKIVMYTFVVLFAIALGLAEHAYIFYPYWNSLSDNNYTNLNDTKYHNFTNNDTFIG
jgi:hypothetical protein